MNKTVSEIIKEVKGQMDEYVRDIHARYSSEPEPDLPALEVYKTTFDWAQAAMEEVERKHPGYYKWAAIYALVDTYYDQSELVRLCKYCFDHYHMPPWWTEDRLYVDTNVKGDEHPPAWTEVLKNIEQGTAKDGQPYKIEVLCMFQYSPAMADFCRQHGVQLVMQKERRSRA